MYTQFQAHWMLDFLELTNIARTIGAQSVRDLLVEPIQFARAAINLESLPYAKDFHLSGAGPRTGDPASSSSISVLHLRQLNLTMDYATRRGLFRYLVLPAGVTWFITRPLFIEGQDYHRAVPQKTQEAMICMSLTATMNARHTIIKEQILPLSHPDQLTSTKFLLNASTDAQSVPAILEHLIRASYWSEAKGFRLKVHWRSPISEAS